jgi:tripartite-type tricarboxylate transporter receptor subunit TctC
MLPNGVPVKIVNQLSNAMKQALENPVLVEKLTKAGIDPVKGGSDEFDQFLKLEIIKWKKIIVNSKINAD